MHTACRGLIFLQQAQLLDQEAVVDFIVLHEDTKNNISKILVAAARRSDIDNIMDCFEKAKMKPSQITVDLFSFYRVYKGTLYSANKKTSE